MAVPNSPRLEQFARLHLPQADRVVGSSGREQRGGRVDVDGPQRTLVALVHAKALAVVAIPPAHDMVLGNGKDQVAFL